MNGATVSNLQAKAWVTPTAGKWTVNVLDNGAVILSCEIATNTSTCSNTSSVSVPAGHFLQVRVDKDPTTGDGSPNSSPFDVSFRY